MNISASVLYNGAVMPQKSEDGLTNLLFACLHDDDDGFIDIEPHSTIKISTGISIAIPDGYMALLLPEGKLAAEQDLDIAESISVLTPTNNGEVCVMLHNDGDYVRTIHNGQAIAKILVIPAVSADFI